MIDALVSGKLYGQAQQREGANGKPFTTAKIRASVGEGEPLFVNVIAFTHSVQETLLALDDGESVALSGELTPKVWTDKDGNVRPAVDLVAHAALTTHQVSRKRQALDRDRG